MAIVALPTTPAKVGEAFTRAQIARLSAARSELQTRVASPIRRSMGLVGEPPPPCLDPSRAYLPVGGMARTLHGDLPAMLIGGLASLFFQTLHPLAMAGVAAHSNYRDDPLGRLQRTAMFVGQTTYGTKDEAATMIRRVRAIHETVRGTARDGRPYAATDPALITWVHATEVSMFLAAAKRYGPRAVSDANADRYLDEMSRVAIDLGAVSVPTSEAALRTYFDEVSPSLALTPEAVATRNFLLRGVGSTPIELGIYTVLVTAAVSLLPPGAQWMLRTPVLPLAEPLVIRPAATIFARSLRWVIPPARS